MKIGDIIMIDGHSENLKRVIFSKRLNCQALQNNGHEICDKTPFTTFRDDESESDFFGSIGDCFALPDNFRGEIEVVGFQEQKERAADTKEVA